MSFDFTGLPTKTDYNNANQPPQAPPTPSEEEIYANRLARLNQRIVRFFSRTGGEASELNIRIGFLTSEDKAALAAAIEGKGFSCSESNGLMTIN